VYSPNREKKKKKEGRGKKRGRGEEVEKRLAAQFQTPRRQAPAEDFTDSPGLYSHFGDLLSQRERGKGGGGGGKENGKRGVTLSPPSSAMWRTLSEGLSKKKKKKKKRKRKRGKKASGGKKEDAGFGWRKVTVLKRGASRPLCIFINGKKKKRKRKGKGGGGGKGRG